MSYLMQIADALLPAVATILAAVLSAVGAYGIRWLRVRLDLDLSARAENDLAAIIDGAIARADQWARARVAAGAEPPAGDDKLGAAIVWARRQMTRRGLPQLAADELSELIEARLGHPDAPGGIRREVSRAIADSVRPPAPAPDAGMGKGGKPPPPPPPVAPMTRRGAAQVHEADTGRPRDATAGRYRDAGLPEEHV